MNENSKFRLQCLSNYVVSVDGAFCGLYMVVGLTFILNERIAAWVSSHSWMLAGVGEG